MKFDDQRKFHRVNFDGRVNLKFLNYSYDYCQIKNLCLTGLFIEGNFLQRRAKNCNIQIFHNDKYGNNSLKASAEVVWGNAKGIDLKFTTMTLENYLLLQTTLINKAEDPEIILRELPNDCPFFISD